MTSSTNIPLSVKAVSSIGHPNPGERFVLVFDTETTGLPADSWANFEPEPVAKKYRDGNPVLNNVYTKDETGKTVMKREPVILPASDASKWPHIVQFSYVLYDNETHTAKIVNEIIRLPEGTVMTPGSEAIHKISLEYAQGPTHHSGRYHPYMQDVLRAFMQDFRKTNVIVAHNLRFDRNMLLVEMDRLKRVPGLEEEFAGYMKELYFNQKEFCTADFGSDECKITAINSIGKFYYKMPRLTYLYTHLFGYAPDETQLHNALIDVIVCFRCFYKLRYNIDICKEENMDPQIAKYINDISPPEHQCIILPIEDIHLTNEVENMDLNGGLVKKRKSTRLLSKPAINYTEYDSEKGFKKIRKTKKRKYNKKDTKNKKSKKAKRGKKNK